MYYTAFNPTKLEKKAMVDYVTRVARNRNDLSPDKCKPTPHEQEVFSCFINKIVRKFPWALDPDYFNTDSATNDDTSSDVSDMDLGEQNHPDSSDQK